MAGESREWRLGHRPALDGVRGVAIGLVLIGHGGVPHAGAAGAVGVTLFFVLSGFLITTLLLEEWSKSGRIKIRTFYGRRVRRLGPAFLVSTATVALMALTYPDYALVTLADVLWACSYLGNWGFALFHPHTAGLGALSGTWSLAVEEQFYLVWPVLLILALRGGGRRRVRGLVLTGIACAMAARLMLIMSGASYYRLYLGTDVNSLALLLGALVAVQMHASSPRPPTRAVRHAATICLLALAIMAVFATNQGWVYVGIGVSACSALMVWALVAAPAPQWSTGRVLRWLGARSYAIYLWNSILAVMLYDQAMSWPIRLVVTVGVSLLLAEASWWLVERPFRRSRHSHLVESEDREVSVAGVRVEASDADPVHSARP